MNDLGPLQTLKQLKEANNITSMGNGRLRVRKPLVPFTSQLETARENNNLIDNSIRSTGNNSHQTTGNNWTSKTRQNGEYAYVPPAARRFYLWDSTPNGASWIFSLLKDPENLKIQLNFTAMTNVLAVIERHAFKEPGFLIGNLRNSKVEIDRFDMGRNNTPTMVIKDDEILKIFYSLPNLNQVYHHLILDLEKFVSQTESRTYFPWICNILLKEEGLEISSARIIPKLYLKYVGIPSIRIVPNALISDLKLENQELRFGYMAIDQARHVVFLNNQVLDFNWCLVGIWVSGIQEIQDEFIQKLSIFYMMNQGLPKLESSNSFLVCLYSKDERFYQVNYETQKHDFWLQKAKAEVSFQNSEQDVILDLENVDIGREMEFCDAYNDLFGV